MNTQGSPELPDEDDLPSPRSAQAPVDVMPVANDSQRQQDERDHEQSNSFRRVDRVPLMARCGTVSGGLDRHGAIVAPGNLCGNQLCYSSPN